MKAKITFKEYVAMKQKLREAGNNMPIWTTVHEVNKYCKVPLTVSKWDDEKLYIPLKPKDTIKILWEQVGEGRIPKSILIMNEDNQEDRYFFTWHAGKIEAWLAPSAGNVI